LEKTKTGGRGTGPIVKYSEEDKCREEKRKQGENLLKSGKEDKVDMESERESQRFKEIMEEDKKKEKRD
jgi:hypothetical protein